ncbi:hypothetical protein IMG5_201560 [Ichthyophthirius multifiliis]|uniref:Casein kinase I n=1 Tax=Ichthyophthirius multifiliis TaxID=5932 RepID=G0R5V4_ICHMU|nr:hypothetical protein IMG5_201560 [Ichthyophthirius multifiliis]EGR27131.1 hypothetical protein IMG5_201560 [Ichthyophthirius multifiliis]|eukprot:XP_004024015.1 hypothetical protein IMG5_201560 [Ichthyophthirius multifiliis]
MILQLMQYKLKLGSICLLAVNMLNSLEEIHNQNIVHRNLKPRKIITDSDLKSQQLYIIDFKYSQKYKNKNGNIQKYSENDKVLSRVFCNKFSSINTHLGISASRKDDLESLGYIFIYIFRNGQLFTKKNITSKDEKLKYYEELKLNFIPEILSNYNIPQEFINYMNYVKSLSVLDIPDYDYWKKIFKQLPQKMNFPLSDYKYEWVFKIYIFFILYFFLEQYNLKLIKQYYEYKLNLISKNLKSYRIIIINLSKQLKYNRKLRINLQQLRK